jgi:hypothetical protein
MRQKIRTKQNLASERFCLCCHCYNLEIGIIVLLTVFIANRQFVTDLAVELQYVMLDIAYFPG